MIIVSVFACLNKQFLEVSYHDDRGSRESQPRYQPVDVSNLNIKCVECSTDIKDLPFNPRMNDDGTPSRPVYCRNCNSKRRPAFRR